MKSDPIQDYILKSEANLRVAVAVGVAWPEVRQKLVSGFFDALKLRLKRKLKGWEFRQYGQFFVESDTGFYFLKATWANQYSIALQLRDHGEKNVVGVLRDNPDRAKRPFCDELAAAFREMYPSATAHLWWEVRAPLRLTEPDWRKPETLWKLSRKDAKVLDEVAEQLLAVANISEPLIDKLVRKYKK